MATLFNRSREAAKPNFAQYHATVESLRSKLLSNGIKAEAIAKDLAIGGRYRADLAVIDPATKRPLAFFEVRQSLAAKSLQGAGDQLRGFAQAIGNPSIPIYLVTPSGKDVQLARIPVTGTLDATQLILEEVPRFQELLTTARTVMKTDNRQAHRNTVAVFKWVCWAMALVLVGVLVLDYFALYELSRDRLMVLGTAAALVVIPFTRRLKMLGVEFEALESETTAPAPVDPGTPVTPPRRGPVKPVVEPVLEDVKRRIKKTMPGKTTPG